ncbi:hypothetical protein QA639_21365 [Bradyrhizobium pachyrhizi]|uniref:hypothetical protein n=1 Tax=Bradyrhizobium pachyrhizi TaxID=280333 RepID=UPI0024B13FCF|nr:hypothetical protein [Bradyrhizobium pachyrhizi]WFU52260.1 hypothetical protein QA639_21365 [Bradyrhizobium pachyrhizi]
MPHVFEHTPTAQEVFDAACAFFASSPGPSSGLDDICLYRDPTGRSCVAGNFVPDDNYDPRMDDMSVMPNYKPHSGGNSVNNLIEHFGETIPAWFRQHQKLLVQLQSVHDQRDNWRRREWNYEMVSGHLQNVAAVNGLKREAIQHVAARANIPSGWNVVEV